VDSVSWFPLFLSGIWHTCSTHYLIMQVASLNGKRRPPYFIRPGWRTWTALLLNAAPCTLLLVGRFNSKFMKCMEQEEEDEVPS